MYRKQDYDLLSSVELVKSSHEVGDKVAIRTETSQHLNPDGTKYQPTYVILEKHREVTVVCGLKTHRNLLKVVAVVSIALLSAGGR